MAVLKIIGLALLSAVALILALFILYCLLIIVSSLFIDTKKDYRKNSGYFRFLLDSATWLMVVLLRIHVHTSGLEKLPEGRFLFVSNHRSNFDPILSWYVLKKQKLAYISKDGNFKIPFFGKIIRRCCFMNIDRKSAKEAMVTVNKAADLMKSDEVSVGVYPEGTRNKTGERVLLPFHSGIYMIAKKAGVPVVVASVKGTEKIHRNFPKRSSDVYIDIIDVIDAEYIKTHKCDDISTLTYEKIYNNITEGKNQ